VIEHAVRGQRTHCQRRVVQRLVGAGLSLRRQPTGRRVESGLSERTVDDHARWSQWGSLVLASLDQVLKPARCRDRQHVPDHLVPADAGKLERREHLTVVAARVQAPDRVVIAGRPRSRG
jgi:hypothetical protein